MLTSHFIDEETEAQIGEGVTQVTDGRASMGSKNPLFEIIPMGTSPVAQWLRIRLPMQGTRVRALVWEDPTCHRATKPVRYNY